ncbi:cobalt transporter CbtA [Klebsiella michiganensis]|uniref:Cobalt transporter CbtA n=1 Tax=Klebsiella michiganensis TaxID=1134687 RepID=A0A7H4LST3_9ENTR|nr:cobalt transporter CbtA [Klebsiella michiganensis]
MIGKLLFKGMMAGVLAGMVAFAFAHHFGEPQVDRAIGLEKSMSAHAHHPRRVSRRRRRRGV